MTDKPEPPDPRDPRDLRHLLELEDNALLDALRSSLADERPSGLFVELARASYSMRALDADLATLTRDSLLDDLALQGVRTAAGVHTMVFDFSGGSLTVDVAENSVSGVLVAAANAVLSWRRPDGGTGEVDVDSSGWFRVEVAERGPLQLRVQMDGGRPCDTDWLLT